MLVPPRSVPIVLALGAAIVLSLTACAPGDPEPSSTPSSAPVVSATATPSPTATTEPEVSNDDICALLTDAEVASVLGAAYPAATYTFGSLSEPTGGQCVWTNDPEGDVFTDDGSTFELIVFVPGSINPPPAEAPAPGSGAVVATDSGVLFASTDRVFWIRIGGALSVDAAAIGTAQALGPVVLGRL